MTDERKLHGFQEGAIIRVAQRWAHGAKRVLLACPTGGGKTEMGVRCIGSDHRALWVAHSRELVLQARARLAQVYGYSSVGVIMQGYAPTPSARIQVCTVQTLIRRDAPDVDIVVLDECHHYKAEEWRQVPDMYSGKLLLGLTATPERADGSRLRDIFEELVPAASYSELVREGILVPWDVVQPPYFLGRDMAMDPLAAWQMYAKQRKTFAFYMRVEEAKREEGRFNSRGIRTKTVSYQTGKSLRAQYVDGFQGASVSVLNNVYALTEGVDVPEASVILLVRPFLNRSNYVQACGRGGRRFPGKGRALLIDLCGSSHLHGSPVADWEYSLDGKGTPEEEVEDPDHDGEEKESVERDELKRHILNTGLVVAPFSESQEIEPDPVPERRKCSNAQQVEVVLDALAVRKARGVADVARKALSGFAE